MMRIPEYAALLAKIDALAVRERLAVGNRPTEDDLIVAWECGYGAALNDMDPDDD